MKTKQDAAEAIYWELNSDQRQAAAVTHIMSQITKARGNPSQKMMEAHYKLTKENKEVNFDEAIKDFTASVEDGKI